VLDDITRLAGQGHLAGLPSPAVDGYVSLMSAFAESLLLLPSPAVRPTSPLVMSEHLAKVVFFSFIENFIFSFPIIYAISYFIFFLFFSSLKS
jgi:hypothetical protein